MTQSVTRLRASAFSRMMGDVAIKRTREHTHMAGTSVTTDADDDVVSVTTSPAVATISFERKNGLPNYGNESLSIFLQVPLEGDTNDLSLVEKQLEPQAALLKAFVYRQLGTPFEIVDGVVVGEAPAEQPKKSSARGGRSTAAPKATPRGGQLSDDEKESLWAELAAATDREGGGFTTQGGETVFDNRENKRNPKGPDFKFADRGHGLWLDNAPAWFNGPANDIIG